MFAHLLAIISTPGTAPDVEPLRTKTGLCLSVAEKSWNWAIMLFASVVGAAASKVKYPAAEADALVELALLPLPLALTAE